MGGQPSLLILGTRGIPAQHGGFETFAEHLAIHLVERGWRVTVYCQAGPSGRARQITIDEWRGVRRVHIAVAAGGAYGTIVFDWYCVRHALRESGLVLILGYNTAIFALPLRLRKRTVLMNMDGIEWKRQKWSYASKAWLYANEWAGAILSSHLIADHPEIAKHLARKRSLHSITMIPYGAEELTAADVSLVRRMGLEPNDYITSIARLEPENSILELVTAYGRSPRRFRLVCIGMLEPSNSYHRAVVRAAGPGVMFPGAIYDRPLLNAVRYFALAHCHGHQVGGTNPSLVEALGAGNAIVAHDNRFNRWTAGPKQFYFIDVEQCARIFDDLRVGAEKMHEAKRAARARFEECFRWQVVLDAYEALCQDHWLRFCT